MTPKDILEHYNSPWFFGKKTSMSPTSLWNWMQWGYVPLDSQLKIEKLSGGKLTASFEHAKKELK